MKVKVYMDATAGIAMMKRQGLGTVKHVATQYLWIQESGAKQGGGASPGPDIRELCGLDDEVTGRSTDELSFKSDGLYCAHDLIWL